MSNVSRRDFITWAVLIAVATVAVAIGIFVGISWDTEDGLEQKTGERIVELIFIVFMGALIALAIDLLRQKADERDAQHQIEVARREYLVEEISEFCAKLDAIYQPIKKIRRDIRLAVGYDFHANIQHKLYKKTTAQLNDQQLALEQLHNQISDLNRTDTMPNSMTKEHLTAAERELALMRDYLDDIQTEAEWKTRSFQGNISGTEVPKLRAFVLGLRADRSRADFKSRFVESYKRAKQFLLEARMTAEVEAAPKTEVDPEVEADPEVSLPGDVWPPPKSTGRVARNEDPRMGRAETTS